MVVPGGVTGVCQPLDVLIMKPFKIWYGKQYTAWLQSVGFVDEEGNVMKASHNDMLSNVWKAWSNVPESLVKNSQCTIDHGHTIPPCSSCARSPNQGRAQHSCAHTLVHVLYHQTDEPSGLTQAAYYILIHYILPRVEEPPLPGFTKVFSNVC